MSLLHSIKYLSVIFLIIFSIAGCSENQSRKIENTEYHNQKRNAEKHFTELSQDGSRVINLMCQTALQNYFKDEIINFQTTTLHYLPRIDNIDYINPENSTKLEKPIIVTSVLLANEIISNEEKIKEEMKNSVYKTSYEENFISYRIIKCLVLIENISVSIAHSSSKVTLIPIIVEVKPL